MGAGVEGDKERAQHGAKRRTTAGVVVRAALTSYDGPSPCLESSLTYVWLGK